MIEFEVSEKSAKMLSDELLYLRDAATWGECILNAAESLTLTPRLSGSIGLVIDGSITEELWSEISASVPDVSPSVPLREGLASDLGSELLEFIKRRKGHLMVDGGKIWMSGQFLLGEIQPPKPNLAERIKQYCSEKFS